LRQMPDHLRNRATLQVFYVGFNHASGPFRENPLLRLAVMHAIDREFIVRVLQAGKDTLANGVIPPGMLGHDESRPGWSKDPRRAAELLAQAGYPGGAGLPELVYISNDTEGFRNLADRLVTDLAAVGIKARISMSDLGAFIAALAPDAGTPPSADLFRMSYYADWPDPDNFLGLQFTGGMTDNFGEYANPAFDDLILLGRRESDPALRESLYREAESILLADAALVPIYWYGEDLLVRPELENVQLSPLGHFAIAWDEVSFRR
ncbi:MAG TPA: ABC transporter substrate-binding protein, partial [Candidatus Polarisedimenticolia bacterium]|nr:ABC transporter substrate-binding protein [Candidatus Polarisedimenticolia bacterium]